MVAHCTFMTCKSNLMVNGKWNVINTQRTGTVLFDCTNTCTDEKWDKGCKPITYETNTDARMSLTDSYEISLPFVC